MKIIGNIVTNTKFTISERFNFVESFDDIIQDIPTLIIGFDEIETLVPDFNIFEHKINDELFWTFHKNEKKDKFNEIVIEFIDYCFSVLVKDVKYIYIDPIHYSGSKLKKISKKISELTNPKGIIVDNRVIYIYGDNMIFSFDTDVCELVDIKKDTLIEKYGKVVGGFLDYESIFIKYGSDISSLNDKVMYLPFLYYTDNG